MGWGLGSLPGGEGVPGRAPGGERGRSAAGLGASFMEPGEGVDVAWVQGEGVLTKGRLAPAGWVCSPEWLVLGAFQFASMETARPETAAEGALK